MYLIKLTILPNKAQTFLAYFFKSHFQNTESFHILREKLIFEGGRIFMSIF